MDIPKLMTTFASQDRLSVVDTLIKNVSLKASDEKKEKLNVFMDLDLDAKGIDFHSAVFHERDPKKYCYFGNNPSAGKQIYAVRDVKSMANFWVGRMKGILMNLTQFVEEGTLKNLLKEVSDEGLFDETGINLQRLLYQKERFEFDRTEKSLMWIQESKREKISFDKFFSMVLDGGSAQKFILVIPRIVKEGKTYVISTQEDYLSSIEKMMDGSSSGGQGICHICGENGLDINTKEYSSKFDKSGLGKVFVTTTINYAPSFKKDLHERNFAICRDCYEKFLHGEKEVMRKFRLKVAREDCVLLFEGLDRKIDTQDMVTLSKDIDAVFNLRGIKEWTQGFIREVSKRQKVRLYQFNMIFYKTDGKATAIKKTIENISSVRFAEVIEAMDWGRKFVNDQLPFFTLGHIYGLVPIQKNKKGEQINIKVLLEFYSDIVKGYVIRRDFLMEIIAEAFSRMMNELRSAKIRNYENLLAKKPAGERASAWDVDVNIERLAMKYIALIHALERLQIMDKEVFELPEKDYAEQTDWKEYVAVREEFLSKNGFSSVGRGLFYIGALMYEIGQAQYQQGHTQKPILDKLEYKGMNKADILNFYNDLCEKLRQYRTVIYIRRKAGAKCESFIKQIAYYIGSPDALNGLDERESVFYIMSGYGFSVSNRKGNTKDGNVTTDALMEEDSVEE